MELNLVKYIAKLFVKALIKRGYRVNKIDNFKEIYDFVERFRKNYISCNLIRIGGTGDGGYLIPNNLEEVKYCFSPGVGHAVNLEAELSNSYDIKCFLADASVESLPVENRKFQFTRKFLGNRTDENTITLSDWIFQSVGIDNSSKILQMDIEGGEYDVLNYESIETLASFSALIIEFHNLDGIFEKSFLKMISTVFEKIYRNFKICHVHANNAGGFTAINGIGVPRVIEITFLRIDLIDRFLNNAEIMLPHVLDEKNESKIPDIVMPEIWWKK